MCFEDWAPKGFLSMLRPSRIPASGHVANLRARSFKAENEAFFSMQAQAESGSCVSMILGPKPLPSPSKSGLGNRRNETPRWVKHPESDVR